MIPIRLALRNFMPYKENVPPLQFNGLHTATICGDNGNGKSALIDAITWALWGRARAKSDDELIHLGESEMEVEFDFAVGDQAYRVIRKHAKPKSQRASGRTILEFQIATEKGFRSLTGNSVIQTQQEIIKVLHMDYDTFKNSALLLQGHADEFTLANPARRKQVLSNILGLTIYDELEEQAKEKARERETENIQLQNTVKDIDEELVKEPLFEIEQARAQQELTRIEDLLRVQESRLHELRLQKESLKGKREQLAQIDQRIADTSTAKTQWDNQTLEYRTQIKIYEEIISQSTTTETGYAQFFQAKRLCEENEKKLALDSALNKRKYQLDMAIMQASQALLKEHTLLENKIAELISVYEKLPDLRNKLIQAQSDTYRLAEVEKTLNLKKQQSQEMQTLVHYLESSGALLEKEIAEIVEKLKVLSIEGDAKCPLCETELGPGELRLIEAKYNSEKQHKSSALKANQIDAAHKKRELKVVDSEITKLEISLRQGMAQAESRINLLKLEIAESEKASSQLGQERAKIVEIEEMMATKNFAASEQSSLNRIDEELAQINYNAPQHDEIKHQMTSLEQFEGAKRKLEEAERFINQIKESLNRAEQAFLESKRNLNEDNARKEILTAEISALPKIDDDLSKAEAERQQLAAGQKITQEKVASAKAQLQRCSDLKVKKAEKSILFNQAENEEKIYKELAIAFGKKGIQALLIEIALPEIEAEANKLLGRMTDNRMHVKMETQKETKKGDVSETLDINISDELGTRSYDMFSGGEAFRINFAIRIALSKLLARRAGAPLPTLIVDEGFGTQDNMGLEKVKEAITSIQDDFDKILIITHIEDLRDAFPARIDVVKTAEGSTLSVS